MDVYGRRAGVGPQGHFQKLKTEPVAVLIRGTFHRFIKQNRPPAVAGGGILPFGLNYLLLGAWQAEIFLSFNMARIWSPDA
jgi:hypothetical protein